MPSKRLALLAHGKQASEELGNACFVVHDGGIQPSSRSRLELWRKSDWTGLLKRLWEVPRSVRVRRWKGGRIWESKPHGEEPRPRRACCGCTANTTTTWLDANHTCSYFELWILLDLKICLPRSAQSSTRLKPPSPRESAVELSASSSHQAMAVHLSGKMPTYQFECNRLPVVWRFPATRIVDLLFS